MRFTLVDTEAAPRLDDWPVPSHATMMRLGAIEQRVK